MYKTIRKQTINEIITAQADPEETNILVCGIATKMTVPITHTSTGLSAVNVPSGCIHIAWGKQKIL